MRNNVQLLGHLGADPEIREVSGRKMATFSLCTTESWRDRGTGERVERATWHQVVVWKEGVVKAIQCRLKKGSRVLVEGKIRYEDWTDKDQVRHHTAKIYVESQTHQVLFLDVRSSSDQPEDD